MVPCLKQQSTTEHASIAMCQKHSNRFIEKQSGRQQDSVTGKTRALALPLVETAKRSSGSAGYCGQALWKSNVMGGQRMISRPHGPTSSPPSAGLVSLIPLLALPLDSTALPHWPGGIRTTHPRRWKAAAQE
jgi:hypothetical protein